MYFKSKKISMLILAITSLICSRAMFALFNDPEGPNLLIVVVMALVLYFVSLSTYSFKSSATGLKRLLLAILVQAIVATGLYFFLNWF